VDFAGVAFTGVPFTVVFFTGVFFAGVALAVAEEAVLVTLFTGVVPTVFLAALTGLAVGVLVIVSFLTGSDFCVPRGVRGFATSLTGFLAAATGVFLAGVAVDTALLAGAVVAGFFAGVDVAAGVTLDGVAADATGVAFAAVETGAPAALSFLGTLLAGAVAELTVSVAVAADFVTGVDLTADVAVLAGVVVAGFFAVELATLETFPTLAGEE
jgi:hypothetical protein